MKRTIVACVVCLAGCATSPEVTSWNMAREVNSPAAYRDFVARYPSSDHAEEARALIAQSEQERIQKAGSVVECAALAKTHPDPETVRALGELALKAALADASIDSQYLYLEVFGGQPGAPAVRARLEELEFERAARDGSPAPMEFFLRAFPGSRHASEGQRLLQEKAFLWVKQQGAQAAYKGYLARFPDGPRAAEVRGWLRPSSPPIAAADVQARLDEAVAKSRSLQRHACALSLASAIRGGRGPVDPLRRQLRDLESDPRSSLPASCGGASLRVLPGREGTLAEALDGLLPLDGQRAEVARLYEACQQREALAGAAVVASSRTADDLETAEVSEEVLGSGPLGNLAVGDEKGSQAARKAHDRFQAVQEIVRREREELRRMLAEAEGLHGALLSCVTGCVDAK